MSGQWFCKIGGARQGPYTPQQLKALVAAGKLRRHDLVRHGNVGRWVKAQTVAGLFSAAKASRTPNTQVLVAAVIAVVCIGAAGLGMVGWQSAPKSPSVPVPAKVTDIYRTMSSNEIEKALEAVPEPPEAKPPEAERVEAVVTKTPLAVKPVVATKPSPPKPALVEKPPPSKPVTARTPEKSEPDAAEAPAAAAMPAEAEKAAAKAKPGDRYSEPGPIDLSQPIDVEFKDPLPKPNEEMAEELFGPMDGSEKKPAVKTRKRSR